MKYRAMDSSRRYTNYDGTYSYNHPKVLSFISQACKIDCHGACRGRAGRSYKCCCVCHKIETPEEEK